VVAARMSLSFPMLISAVPLYAINLFARARCRRLPSAAGSLTAASPATSPIHLFDSPVPRWPTFAINLIPFPEDQGGEQGGVRQRLSTKGQPQRDEGTLDGPGKGKGAAAESSYPPFLHSIFGTAQNWIDNSQMRVAGYRDRIAHVRLTKGEGGMNLTMKDEAIDKLARRGRVRCRNADQPLFAQPAGGGSRLTWGEPAMGPATATTCGLLEGDLQKLYTGTWTNAKGERTMTQLNERPPLRTPPGYPWQRAAQRSFALNTTIDLLALINEMG